MACVNIPGFGQTMRFLVITPFLLSFQSLPQTAATRETEDFVVSGFLPDYCNHVNVTAASDFLTDLILYSVHPANASEQELVSLSEQCCIKPHQYKDAAAAVNANNDSNDSDDSIMKTRIWASIGGHHGRSQAFPQLGASVAFLDNLVELCEEYNLHGIDMFWDDPKTKQDMDTYSRILMDAADTLHAEGFQISLTTRQFFRPDVVNKMDRINLLAFDLLQSSGEKKKRKEHHHASLESVGVMLDNLVHVQDYPPSKIILGIPAYARHGTNPKHNVRTFAELIKDGYRDLDSNSYKGYLFDSPGRVRDKVELAKKFHLGGVFLWELGQDVQVRGAPGGMLLEAAAVGEYTFFSDEDLDIEEVDENEEL